MNAKEREDGLVVLVAAMKMGSIAKALNEIPPARDKSCSNCSNCSNKYQNIGLNVYKGIYRNGKA